ncbi:aspartate racemase [Dickeya dianthicola]|uniref:Aspartate racemase n=1 Tax=Dickeya dianthicola TaxID=204039 RepID=A0AAX1C1T9_9GAMM|nr:amino acid racemase [Dickeya dianthicola]PWD69245.1 aspartate racemase [Dickeya dianthicola]
MSVENRCNKTRYGIVGGLGSLGAADIFFKLVKAVPSASGAEQPELIFEQHPFAEGNAPGESSAAQSGRKLYVFDMIRQFENRRVDAVLLPCFLSHTFIDELKAESRLPIVSMMDALSEYVGRRHPNARRLGVLTSDYVRTKGLFEHHFSDPCWELLYPSEDIQKTCVMPAIYGPEGIKAGHLHGTAVERLVLACRNLMEQGAELIIPGFTEIPIVLDALTQLGLPVIDANLIYARYTIANGAQASAKEFKIGIVGGVGPAATVDFVGKIVRHTRANKDQEHIKLVIEQNPQIPDRTENLIGNGTDPTVALYSTCKKLEAADADVIAIPCNTAHAFVERIQPYLGIPVINMLTATVEHVQATLPGNATVGLLATNGTVRSGIYADAAAKVGIKLLIPDEANQTKVMNAIYGERGVKAGFTDGECRDELFIALSHLVERGASAVILGCTELPLVLGANPRFVIAGKTVAVLDPTEILAKKCIALGARTGHVESRKPSLEQ